MNKNQKLLFEPIQFLISNLYKSSLKINWKAKSNHSNRQKLKSLNLRLQKNHEKHIVILQALKLKLIKRLIGEKL